MEISDFKKTMLIDATGERLKMGLFCPPEPPRIAAAEARAMECFFESLGQLCPTPAELRQVEAFALCTGPGSALGTRSASVVAATISKFSGAKIFEWNCMEVAACAISRACAKFSLFAPSRKGFANMLKYNNKITDLREIKTCDIAAEARGIKILLRQRTPQNADFGGFEDFDLDLPTAFEIIMQNPALARFCPHAPDAKPLTKREYVKWKAQAHI